ncbi:MAG TPA: CHAT domain-containing protein [Terriglobales bacterium]|jgi:CHAT domain-containing protein/Flp pilus assembly protein TadD
MKLFYLIGPLFLGTYFAATCCAQNPQRDTVSTQLIPGVLIEEVHAEGPAHRTGLRPQDILLCWKRGAAAGEIKTPFDLASMFWHQLPYGPVDLYGVRNGTRKHWVLTSDASDFSIRPRFRKHLLARYLDASSLLRSSNPLEGISHFRLLALGANNSDTPWLASWFLIRASKLPQSVENRRITTLLYDEALLVGKLAAPVQVELLRLQAESYANTDDGAATTLLYRKLLDKESGGDHSIDQVNALLSISLIQLHSQKYSEAEAMLRQAVASAELLIPNSLQRINALVNLAVVYENQGKFRKAEESYLKALNQENKNYPGSSYLRSTLGDLGVLLDQEGDFQRAAEYFNRAYRVAEHIDPNSFDTAEILSNLADCELELAQPSQAATYQKKALLIAQKLDPTGLTTANALAGLGKIAREQQHLEQAEKYYEKALQIAGGIDNSDLDRSSIMFGLGVVLKQQLRLVEAENNFLQALSILNREEPDGIDRAIMIAELAGSLAQEHRDEEAKALYSQAITLFDAQVLHIGGIDDVRSRYRAERQRYYHEYIAVLARTGDASKALETLETARARTLFEFLRTVQFNSRSLNKPSDLEEQASYTRLYTAADSRIRLLTKSHTNAELAKVEQEIQESLFEYQQIQTESRIKHETTAHEEAFSTASAGEIQGMLDANTILLEYSLGAPRSLLLLVSHKDISVFELPDAQHIEQVARKLYQLLSASENIEESGSGTLAEYRNTSKQLATMILGPVKHLLSDKRLLIVADGVLQYLPFAALPNPGAGDGRPLVVDHEITNLPSASVLFAIRNGEKRKKPSKGVAILADPVFESNDDRLKHPASRISSIGIEPSHLSPSNERGVNESDVHHLGRLLYTRDEARAISGANRPEETMLAVDFSATRSLALSSELSHYRIVHFATHGIFDSKHPELSGLVLSLFDQKGHPEPGFLILQDIYNMKLPVDMVVLSGCETALGDSIQGEGLIGLTRGFMYAGASRVVATLWKVSDVATAELMGSFYNAMEKRNLRPAAALRQAQIEMWKSKQWNSPYYWAAFQIQGEWK